MYWLARPSYWRWAAAILLVGTSVYFELRPTPTVDHPFAGADLVAGADVTQAEIAWLPVPVGVLPEIVLEGFLRVDVASGQPLVPSVLDPAPSIPTGWWAISVPVPEGSIPGTEVRLVVDVRGTPRVVPGLLVRSFEEATIEGTTALVAIPEGEAGAVAAALADGALSVLVSPPG